VKRLAILTIETSDDGKLCGEDCPFLDQQSAGKEWCRAFFGYAARGWNDQATRIDACLSATAQADRLVAVRDAAKQWKAHVDEFSPLIGDGEKPLYRAVQALESTRDATGGNQPENTGERGSFELGEEGFPR
jgi:hypothetical protein